MSKSIYEVNIFFMDVARILPHTAEAAGNAKPIYQIAKSGMPDGVPQSLRDLADDNGFGAEAGALLVNNEGVLLGVGDGSDPHIMAAAGDRLTSGDYVIAGALSDDSATQAVFAWAIGGYRFDRYKSAEAAKARLIAPPNADVEEAQRAARAVAMVRDLVNTPAGDMGPVALEDAARALAEEFSADCDVVLGDDLLEKNFPMVHAVGRAATEAPRLIDIRWGREDAPKVTLVGKGVTFDSGGLNIKGAASMSLMKKDMGGGAHALGLGRMIMEAGLNLRLRIIIPAVENAISGNAFRPSDVLASRKGLSVEIGNTDAEGRLILADALALGGEEDPALMVSLATLTGAARVALGPEIIPFYTDDDSVAGRLSASSERVFDPVWRLPLWDRYDGMLSSQIADVNHISGGSFAGSMTAALFLRRFVPDSTRWMHFDLYAWRPKSAPGRAAGGEAQAIRALFVVLQDQYGA